MTKKLFIKTYGCQMNLYDSIKMYEILQPFGFEEIDNPQSADMIILNTCHIREKASEKVYSELGRIKKMSDHRVKLNQNPVIIAVAGCTGQAEGKEIFKRAPYVDIVVGPQSYHTLPDLLAQLARSQKHLINLNFVEEAKFDHLPQNYNSQGATAGISIQEGCDKFCTFCVVPYTRGAEFSRSVEDIYRESMMVVAKGAKEINLLGQNVNAYHGKSSHTNEIYSIADLIKHLATIKELQRIRYTTSHPRDMSDELIALHGTESKLIPFLHLPVQSGSNKILKAMNRKHTREEYLTIIDKLRVAKPDIVLSSDFIVGFPTETDEDFSDTLDLVKKVQYGQCFSFKYSPRPGTPAASMPQLPEHIKSERLQILQNELFKQQESFNNSCIDKVLPVLFEKNGKLPGQVLGKTIYMQSAYVMNNNQDLIGKILPVKVQKGLVTSVECKLL